MGQEREALASKRHPLRERPLLLDNVFHILLTTLNNLMGLQEFMIDYTVTSC